ncbi:MAG: hypothetical protein EOM24_30465, partial [Chloroflexia bacterium]|nr:hypothetical protein [Chloroflexia bacterium]
MEANGNGRILRRGECVSSSARSCQASGVENRPALERISPMTHSARRYEALCASVSLSPTPTLSAAEEALRLRLAAHLDTTVPGLIGRNRTPAVSRRRRLAMWLLRHQGYSLKAIGRILE